MRWCADGCTCVGVSTWVSEHQENDSAYEWGGGVRMTFREAPAANRKKEEIKEAQRKAKEATSGADDEAEALHTHTRQQVYEDTTTGSSPEICDGAHLVHVSVPACVYSCLAVDPRLPFLLSSPRCAGSAARDARAGAAG